MAAIMIKKGIRRMLKLNKEILEGLKALDTPTVCNALEVVDPNRRTEASMSVRLYANIRNYLPW